MIQGMSDVLINIEEFGLGLIEVGSELGEIS